MLRVRLLVVAGTALLTAPVLLFIAAAAALVVATALDTDVVLPGLVRIATGHGTEIASASLDGAGVLLWWLGSAALLLVVLLLGDRFLAARRPDRRA